MSRNTYQLLAAAMAIGLVASACGGSPNSATKATSSATKTTSSAAQLQSLIPTPANTARTDGPDSIPDGGIHMHFFVNGAASAVLDAYKSALEGKGWAVTVVSSGGWEGNGGATYTATKGDTYGVFDGGGTASTTDVNACAWASQPANPNCGGGNRR